MGELWCVCCEDLEENWPCYNRHHCINKSNAISAAYPSSTCYHLGYWKLCPALSWSVAMWPSKFGPHLNEFEIIMGQTGSAVGRMTLLSFSLGGLQWNWFKQTREIELKTHIHSVSLPDWVIPKSCLLSLSWKTTCLERPPNSMVTSYSIQHTWTEIIIWAHKKHHI